MKKVGMAENGDVIAQMSLYEWTCIGGPMRQSRTCSYNSEPDGGEFKPHALYAHLDEIKRSSPDLARLRATLQSFLALTDDAAIQKVFSNAGVAPLVDRAKYPNSKELAAVPLMIEVLREVVLPQHDDTGILLNSLQAKAQAVLDRIQ